MSLPEKPGDAPGGVPVTSPKSLVTDSGVVVGAETLGASTGSVPVTMTQSITQQIPAPRSRTQTWFGENGGGRMFFRRWGFPLFVLIVLIVGRDVLLPFVFAGLIAYILEPIVRWMADRPDGTRRMPRGLAIIGCYLVFIAAVAGFLLLLVPRLSSEVSRLGKEVPGLLTRLNEEWTPEAARWIEGKVPSLAAPKPDPDDAVSIVEQPLPPNTAFTVKPMMGGGYTLQLTPGGVDIKPQSDGSFRLLAREARTEPMSLEDRLRSFVKSSGSGLQSMLNNAVRFGQTVITGFIRGIFLFFFTLMIGAFLLIDLEKVHLFLRNLFPSNVRDDYDIVIAGIDRGLSGVIRGQLLICLINGALTYVGLLVFGVKYSLILAIVAGLMSLIPIFGSILSSVPIVIVALASGEQGIDIFRGLAMTLWIIGIHFIEANLLNPKIIGTAAKIHPVLVIFSLFFGEHAFGLVGALLAVPVLSAISVLFMYFYKKTWRDAPPRGIGRTATGPLPRPADPPPKA